jgi:Na+/H+-dicarboxylate symporter/ABC-type amino acid transport substrate-binding protein
MSFSKKVLVGLTAGIATGIFFGELVSPLRFAAEGFVKLLQMTVLPYVFLSIVTSVGSLEMDVVRRLGLRAGAVIATLWVVALSFAFLMPLAFPPLETASFFSTSLVERRPPFNLLDLYIPANPFHALANNIVPAVVLFSFLLGVSLIAVPGKKRLLDPLTVAMEGIGRATRMIVRLTPYGVFAIAANAAGTLSFAQVGRIQVYLVAYGVLALILAFVALPGLVAALTGIPAREMFSENRDAIMTAVVAGDLFIVLPSLIESCGRILARYQPKQAATESHVLPEVIVPVSFNFPHTGKLLSLSFILFAGWLSDARVPVGEYPRLAVTGMLTFFGSLNAAIPFLLDTFRVPADTFQLFLATSVINARLGTLIAVVHTITVALLGSAAITGMIQFNAARLLRYLLVLGTLAFVAIGGVRLMFTRLLPVSFDGASLINRMQPLHPHFAVEVLRDPAQQAVPQRDGPSVTRNVLARGTLRVGFFPNRIPYAFIGGNGQLTGLEVELAYSLANDLGVVPQFMEIPSSELARAMDSGRCDIIMSGALVSPRRELDTLFSRSYLDETMGFVVLDHRREEFLEWSEIREHPGLRLAVPNLPYYIALVHDRLPQAQITGVDPDSFELDEKAPFDAYVLPAERGSTRTLLHPKFTVVVPEPGLLKAPLAYPLARHDREWAEVVNSWIELRQKDGTFDALYRHWVLGERSHSRTPRWSVIRNLLHWVA